MAYDVVQKIRGRYYLYRVTEAVWDPEKKNSRQRREYIGPCDRNGKLDESRRRTASVPAPAPGKLYWSKNLGQYHLLVHLAVQSGLKDALIEAFGDTAGKDILALAVMRIAQPSSLRSVGDSVSATYLRELLGIDRDYSSQRMSEIVHAVGRNEDARKRYCASAMRDSGTVVFDTAALFSSSKLYDMLEYGRRYRKSGLPQVNMGYVHSLRRGMPVYYKLYPGSIADSATLINLVKELRAMGSSAEHLVMDRGFYSLNNIRSMRSEGFGFTIPVPSGRDIFKSALSAAMNDLENPENMFRFHGRTEMYADLRIRVPFGDAGGMSAGTMRVLVFQNNSRRKDEIDTLAERIDTLEREAEQTGWSEENVRALFSGRNADMRTFFDISGNSGYISLSRKRNAVSFAMRKCGRLILLTTSGEAAEDVLEMYHLRDWVEKDYEALKDDMDGGLEYVRSSISAEGMMFIQFIATGLRMYSCRIISGDPMLRRLGMPMILRKLNLVTVSKIGDTMLISEIGKKQRLILEAFGADMPSI
ncbi:MAG: transposase [Candidatus Methanoplasma sp.]|jgi:transposase|nr:transposase [Candidatus Methanoplasma sp.]